ncbi:MAG: hypothetical protein NC347_00295 [Clostridium sp.]|nr:hypothetical protein [Clostridium sp.]
MDNTNMDERENNYETVCENVIEFLRNQKTMTCTFCQGRFVSKIKKMAQDYPDEVKIITENSDGSIVAKLPIRALHLNLTKKREYTEEEREELRERMSRAREKSGRFNKSLSNSGE